MDSNQVGRDIVQPALQQSVDIVSRHYLPLIVIDGIQLKHYFVVMLCWVLWEREKQCLLRGHVTCAVMQDLCLV